MLLEVSSQTRICVPPVLLILRARNQLYLEIKTLLTGICSLEIVNVLDVLSKDNFTELLKNCTSLKYLKLSMKHVYIHSRDIAQALQYCTSLQELKLINIEFDSVVLSQLKEVNIAALEPL